MSIEKQYGAALEKQLTRSAAESAAEVLGLEVTGIDTVTVDEVKAAYRNALKAVHPDTGAFFADACNMIYTARKAKELLQEWVGMRPDPACSVCRGSGYIKGSGFSSRECPRCMRGTRR